MSQDNPSYIICPNCKEKINLDYNKKVGIETNDINSLLIKTSYILGPGKTVHDFINLSICNHCKVILGIGNKA